MILTIKELSEEIGTDCSCLIEDFKKAGVYVFEDDVATDEMRQRLLECLRREHGDSEEDIKMKSNHSEESPYEREYLLYKKFKELVIKNDLLDIKKQLSNLDISPFRDVVNNIIFPRYDTRVDEWANGATRTTEYEKEPSFIQISLQQKDEGMAIYLFDVFFLQFGHANSRKLIMRYLSLAIELNASHELLAKLIQVSPEFAHDDINNLLLSNNMLSKEYY